MNPEGARTGGPPPHDPAGDEMRTKMTAVLCVAAAVVLVAGACTRPSSGGGTANTPPVADLLAAPLGGPAPLPVDFSGVLSSDPGGTVVGYGWDFGDGGTSTEAEPSHTYASPGNYTVTLTVTDNAGATDTASQVIDVSLNTSGLTFVDDDGVDSASCGTLGDPCASIALGITRASDEGNVENREVISLMSGPEPEVYHFNTVAEEREALGSLLTELINSGVNPGEVACFGRTERYLANSVIPELEAVGVGWKNLSEQGQMDGQLVSIGTMHRAKGLEFRVVILSGCSDGLVPLKAALESASDNVEYGELMER